MDTWKERLWACSILGRKAVAQYYKSVGQSEDTSSDAKMIWGDAVAGRGFGRMLWAEENEQSNAKVHLQTLSGQITVR